MTPLPTMTVDAASCPAGSPWYAEYRRLRHRIFVVEQGWTGLTSETEPDATRPDPADDLARFWLARQADAHLVGAVRIRPVADVFPHEALFRHHLQRGEMIAMRPRMGTLTSLAVDRGWRGVPCVSPDGHVATPGSLLLRAALAGSARSGLRALVATAQTIVSARALIRAGFRVIDPPAPTRLHDRFLMCNVGIVLDRHDRRARSLAAYFEARHRRILELVSIDAWFCGPSPLLDRCRLDLQATLDHDASDGEGHEGQQDRAAGEHDPEAPHAGQSAQHWAHR
jgi:N-acyl-L-homoserine lactone synthetase